MTFSDFTRTESGNVILLKNTVPINNVGSLKFFKDNAKGAFSKKEFRWSFNTNYWASWETLNQGNFTRIKAKGPYLFFEIRYVGSGTVSSFSVEYLEKTTTAVTSTANGTDVCKTTIPVEQTVTSQSIKNYDQAHAVNSPTLIDADTLCGRDCEYYLWRPNQKGEQPISSVTNLQQILTNLTNAINNSSVQDAMNVDGAGVGVYYNRVDKTLYFKKLIEGNKIFITETPQGQISISMDDASINELFDELGALNGVNIGGGSGEIFKQRSGEDFEFRTIAAGNANVVITTVGDQVRISLDASISGAPTWSDPVPVSADVGGIFGSGKGGTYAPVGNNSIQMLENILYEYFPPRINFNLDPSPGYYEKWDPAVLSDVSVYGTFDNIDFLKVRVNDVSVYATLLGGFGHTNYSPEVSSGSFSFNDGGFNGSWNDIVYSIKVYHNVNLVPMQPTEASAAINFVLPYIWGVVDNTVTIDNIDSSILEYFHAMGQKKIAPKQSNEITFVTGPIFKAKFVYAYDATYGDLNSIFDVKNDFNVTTSFDSSVINVDLGASPSPIPYKVYIKNHWIDVDSFKLIFNI